MADRNSSLDLLVVEATAESGAPGASVRILELNSSEPLPADLVASLSRPGSSVEGNGGGPWFEPLEGPQVGLVAGEVGAPAAVSIPPGGMVVEGGVIMCACPDCKAPMSIRLWLMIADCWFCATSIELSEEQEKEALRLIAEVERREKKEGTNSSPRSAPEPPKPAARPPSAPPPSAGDPAKERGNGNQVVKPLPSPAALVVAPASPVETGVASSRVVAEASRNSVAGEVRPTGALDAAKLRGSPQVPPRPVPKQPAPAAVSIAVAPTARSPQEAAKPKAGVVPAVRNAVQVQPARTASAIVRDLFRDMPAWVISLIFHVVLITLLGFYDLPSESEESITLSASIHPRRMEGEIGGQRQKSETKFELPLPKDANLKDPKTREILLAADQEARKLRLDPDAANPYLPPLEKVLASASEAHSSRSMMALRDQRIRKDVVAKEGGTTLSEAAVSRGLQWLADHQFPDGHWSLNASPPGCGCNHMGSMQSTSAGTSLALLPFLGAGQTHQVGHYRKNVALGLRSLLGLQKPDGDMRADSGGNAGMYAHGQASIVLCEAFKITGDEALRVPAQKAIDFIVKSQHPQGGWRYSPREPGDTSVLGWQLMALQSAKAASLTVPDETLALAQQFLDSVDPSLREENDKRSRKRKPEAETEFDEYEYTPRQRTSHAITSEALLCRMYLGWDRGSNDGALVRGGKYLLSKYPPRRDQWNIYHWYYATQVQHHLGGAEWEAWNILMRDTLVNSQEKEGHAAGSWAPAGQHEDGGGRIYVTSLAICTLEVYYRHAPIFRQLNLRER